MTTLLQINTSISNGNGQSSQLARQFVDAVLNATLRLKSSCEMSPPPSRCPT